LVALLYYGSILDESRLDTRLYIEAVSDGWWYSAPLPGGVAVSVFMTDERTVPRGRAKRDFFFIQRLNETQFIRQRCGSEVVGLTLRVAPASTTIRTELKGEDWVAIGDAAATYDPLAGFGVVAALSKGAAVARLLLGEVSVSAAADAYVETELESFRDYLAMRAKIYGRERRWQDNAFWKERHVRN
jgi:flavin-dependent dehydrogenase